MIGSALTLFVAALLSGLIGYLDLIGSASVFAQMAFWVFLALFAVALGVGGLRRPAY
ncbi:DUF1328 domain-containing protein [Engelhardtia mirabilis]|uniref:Uncharacterized protein n=1 Tax=Engelhardtia mirabilis TaxID=2528011 RepID=A0A518BP19_9BACT|nr:hypothetical protein Pla133_38270 [Planctomycetes bacterium Pla133]QDV03051.1 hypothetical protein Pla86_38260 [Planctomycetes bacterium Pla86]